MLGRDWEAGERRGDNVGFREGIRAGNRRCPQAWLSLSLTEREPDVRRDISSNVPFVKLARTANFVRIAEHFIPM